MPLPDASSPTKSYLYSQLSSKTALPGASGAITADLIDSFKNQLYLDPSSEDELRRILLIQMVTGAGSVSGPIPGTQTVLSASNTAGDIYETFAPGVGESWELVALSGTMATGITRMEYKLYDSTTSTYVEFAELTANGTAELEGYPVTISYPVTFVTHPRGTYGSGTNYTYYSVVRVR